MTTQPQGVRLVQAELGQAIVEAVINFATKDIGSVEEFSKTTFKHVKDAELRKLLAETLFGARWLYKLGLVTLATDERRAAHVRAQIIDYAAICEALLVDAATHGVASKHFQGQAWKVDRYGNSLAWPTGRAETRKFIRKSGKCNLAWLIKVAKDESIVDTSLHDRLDWLRGQRNNVHIAEMAAVGAQRYLSTSKRAFEIMMRSAESAAAWMGLHP